jgi:uncharacterized protein
MIVISDTSPIANLIQIDKLDLLNRVFGEVIIPPAVHQEILGLSSFGVDLNAYTSATWISVVSPKHDPTFHQLRQTLDEGESEAIALARELNADWLLIDERAGTASAEKLGLHTIGLIGVLIKAKEKALIPLLMPILQELTLKAGFWIGENLLEKVRKIVNE